MIIETKNFINQECIDEIRSSIKPFLSSARHTAYNRDGLTVPVSHEPNLKEIDLKIHDVFCKYQQDVLQNRFKPQFSSGDSGYEYHLYRPGEVCHYHIDGEVQGRNEQSTLLRYATVILFLTTNVDGHLVFPTQNVEVQPEAGKMVAFPPYGFYGHYTKPSTEDREIIMTWFVYNGLTVNKNI